MKKRILAVLLVLGMCGAALFAQIQLSAGLGLIGISRAYTFTSTFDEDQEYSDNLAGIVNNEGKASKGIFANDSIDFGGYVFFDATYVEADISISGGKLVITPGSSYDAVKLGLAVYGKYPFHIGDLTISPMLGLRYDIFLSATNEYGDKVENGDEDKGTGILIPTGKTSAREGTLADLNELSLKLGAEAKFPLGEKLYLNTQWLWGITINSIYHSALLDWINEYDDDKIGLFTHGLTAKLGIGFNF